jgi:hypothetical protein
MTRMSTAVLMAVLSLCTIAASGPTAVAGPLQSQAVFINPFSSDGEVRSMVVCNGQVYIAVGALDRTKTPAQSILRIYRMGSPGCMYWKDVTPRGRAENNGKTQAARRTGFRTGRLVRQIVEALGSTPREARLLRTS